MRFRARTFCTATVEQAKSHGGEEGYFFANDGVTWKSLGISERVAQSLADNGLNRPSLVQVLYMNCLMK